VAWTVRCATRASTRGCSDVGGIRILGIDPGLGITGYGVVQKEGPTLVYVASGRIVSDPAQDLARRLATILAGLDQVIREFTPMEVAVEKVFVNVNPNSTLLLGQARGAAICAAVMARLPVAEYTALQVKQAVVGQGHARKEQVQEMVKRLLCLPGHAGTDASDALACAICHAHGGLGAMPARGRRVRAGRIA
jgi:crossover junction endodeoxyribonuclease RuvC